MSERHFLSEFFDPRSVAVIGARSKPGFGYQLPIWLIKYGHGQKVRLINPRGGEMHGLKVYRSIGDAPRPIDLAVIISPAPSVPGLLEEIASAGVRNVIIECAGFAETGEGGAELQRKCRAIALSKGLRVIGPNCVGVVNTENRFATSEVIESALTPGNIGLVAQSGIFGSILLDAFPSKGLAISRGVTLGNRLIVDECDALDFFATDPMTRAVILYLEGASGGAKLRASLERITRIKPVIVLKSGRTAEGVAATASHTGSMAGEDAIYDGLFSQTGATRAADVANLLDLTAVFSTQPLPKGNRICVLTTSGSMGAVAIDAAVRCGLAPARLSEETVARVRAHSPAWMNVKNPLDVGPSGIFKVGFQTALDDPGVDMLLTFCTVPYAVIEGFAPLGLNAEAWLGNLGEIRKRTPHKPVVASVLGHPGWRAQMTDICGNNVALVEFPENGIRALAALARYSQFQKSQAAI